MNKNPSPWLQVCKVSVLRSGINLLQDISFELNTLDHLAIVGASGSGKTTMVQAILGKTYYQGNISLDPHLKTSISWIEQQHHFTNRSNTNDLYYQQRFNATDSEDTLTVVESLGGMDNHLGPILSLMKIEYLKTKPLIQLSNGENKKIQIARALLHKPDLLIMDQPFVGLDVETRSDLHQLINQLAQSVSMILITTPDEIPTCITKVLSLHDGKMKGFTDALIFKSIGSKPLIERSDFDSKLGGLLTPSSPPEKVNNPVIEMKQVEVKYGDKKILQGIDWTVMQGERWILSGANGAGKSTLLSLINGDNPQAYSNEIYLFGRRRGGGESIWDLKRKTGYFSPELSVFFDQQSTGFSAIASGLYDSIGLFKKLQAEEKKLVEFWLDVTDTGHLAGKYWYELSISEQRKILLIRALIKNPPLLILDEPLQGLDDAQSRDRLALINTVCRYSQCTLIFVTHYTGQVPEGMDHIMKLHEGKVEKISKLPL